VLQPFGLVLVSLACCPIAQPAGLICGAWLHMWVPARAPQAASTGRADEGKAAANWLPWHCALAASRAAHHPWRSPLPHACRSPWPPAPLQQTAHRYPSSIRSRRPTTVAASSELGDRIGTGAGASSAVGTHAGSGCGDAGGAGLKQMAAAQRLVHLFTQTPRLSTLPGLYPKQQRHQRRRPGRSTDPAAAAAPHGRRHHRRRQQQQQQRQQQL
jgi:hypothetical protein